MNKTIFYILFLISVRVFAQTVLTGNYEVTQGMRALGQCGGYRGDAGFEVVSTGASGAHACINLHLLEYPTLTNEALYDASGENLDSSVVQIGSVSWMWANLDRSYDNEFAELRLNATWNKGFASDCFLRGYGHHGIALFAPSDDKTNAPGYHVLGINGTFTVGPSNVINLAGFGTGIINTIQDDNDSGKAVLELANVGSDVAGKNLGMVAFSNATNSSGRVLSAGIIVASTGYENGDKGARITIMTKPHGGPAADALYINDNQTIAFACPHTPSSSAEAGVTGTISYDSNYIYVWVSTSQNKRVALQAY